MIGEILGFLFIIGGVSALSGLAILGIKILEGIKI